MQAKDAAWGQWCGAGQKPVRVRAGVLVMQVRRIFAGASFGPDALKVLFRAYDEAWAILVPRYGNDQSAIDAGRLRLADIMLALMREDTRDVAWLRDEALRHYQTAAGDR